MYIRDAPFNTLLVMTERMDVEVRQMYYIRRIGTSHLANFIPAYGVATTQGTPWRQT